MKSKVLSVVMALVIMLGVTPFFGVQEVRAAEAWQDAYANFLQNSEPISEIMQNFGKSLTEISFSLYDFDRDGIPEIILTFWTSLRNGDPMPVYTFANNNVVQLGDWSSGDSLVGTSLYSSTDTSFKGLFLAAEQRTPYFHSYAEIINGKLQETVIAEGMEQYEDGGFRESVEIVTPGRIANEWQRLRNAPGSSVEIGFHDITIANIATYLYGWTSPATTSAAATGTPHPFATALREFFSDATGEKEAYLVNMQGVGEVVYAWCVGNDGITRNVMFWMYNGRLQQSDILEVYGAGSFHIITESGYSAYSDGPFSGYELFEKGEWVNIISIEMSQEMGKDDYVYHKGVSVPYSQLDSLMQQYGISENDRIITPFESYLPDATAQILAMTVDTTNAIKVTVNGKAVNFTDQQPTIVDGRTLVPVRSVFESLGFEVSWNDDLRQATLARANDTIIVTIDSTSFRTNGVNHTLDVPAQIIGGSTMLPIRAVLESVGYSLEWDGNTQTVIVTAN